MVARGERLAQLAAAAQTRSTAADRQRMVQESQAWKSMMSTWRLVVAAMPDRPELEQPFAFMQQYMSVHHSAPTPATQFVLVIVIGVSHRGVALAIRLRARAPLC